MVQQSLSNERLMELGRVNYKKLKDICDDLSCAGYWEEPEKIIKLPIHEMLDTYLQAVLVQISLQANGFGVEESKYTLQIMDSNPYELKLNGSLEQTVLCAMKRVLKSPPIILQLCGVYDRERNTRLSGVVFDCFINVVLGILYLNSGKNNDTLKVAEEYFKQISVFLNNCDVNRMLDQRYWFKKISADRLDMGFYEELDCECGFQNMKIRQQERIESMKQEMEQEQKKNQLLKRSESAKRLDE